MECPTCGRTFVQHPGYYRHLKSHDEVKKFNCGKCSKAFKRKDAQRRHELNCSRQQQPSGSGITRRPRVAAKNSNFIVTKTNTAFSNATITRKLKYPTNTGSLDMFDAPTLAMEYQLNQYRQDRQALKFNRALHINFEQAVDPSIVTNYAPCRACH